MITNYTIQPYVLELWAILEIGVFEGDSVGDPHRWREAMIGWLRTRYEECDSAMKQTAKAYFP